MSRVSEADRPDAPHPAPGEPQDWDRVDESSDGSFPASDPPAWVPLHSGPPRRSSRGIRGEKA